MMLSSRSEVRRNFARACARGGVRVSDELIDEWTDQIMEMRDYYEKEVVRLKAMFDAEIGVLRRGNSRDARTSTLVPERGRAAGEINADARDSLVRFSAKSDVKATSPTPATESDIALATLSEIKKPPIEGGL